jgi:uncharacterized protein (DUF2141 family)
MPCACSPSFIWRIPRTLGAVALIAGASPLTAHAQGRDASPTAAPLLVNVTGVAAASGMVRCALFAGAEGFPKDDQFALQVLRVVPEAAGTVACRFTDVPDGRYAVSVAHDVNGNGEVDANMVGQPTEPWGTTKGVRPRFRPPRFDEAAITITSDAAQRTITVQVKR